MKIKVLVNCRDQLFLQDMFVSAGKEFRCLSTSGFTEDIVRHQKYVDPDVFLTVVDEFDYNTIQQYCQFKEMKEFYGTLFVLSASQQICDDVNKLAPELFNIVIPKPANATEILSAIAAAMEPPQTDEPEPVAIDKKHILVIDDDKTTLRLLKTALEEKNYDVTAMASGKMAEKYLETKTTDLILLDYQMPKESGADVLRTIRMDLRLKKIPVIFLSGVSDYDRVQEVIAMRPQGYLLKPINMERLFLMIKSLLH